MAIYKTIHKKGKYRDSETKEDVIRYILNPFKTPSGYVGGYAIDPTDVAESMEKVSELFDKDRGIQIRHIIVSFAPNEIKNPAIANEIAKELMHYIGRKYQVIYAVHETTGYLHFHMAFNSVSYITGQRYYGTKQEHFGIVNTLKFILRKYGIYRLEEKYVRI